jgi:hypothetical protein
MSQDNKSDPFPTLPRRQLFRDMPAAALPRRVVDERTAAVVEAIEPFTPESPLPEDPPLAYSPRRRGPKPKYAPGEEPWVKAGVSKVTWWRREQGLRKAVDEVD